MLPLLFNASHVYAPSSSFFTFLMVMLPWPSSDLVVTLGGSPTCPQLSRHTMMGVGTPIASHSMTRVSPSDKVAVAGGGRITVGGAENGDDILEGPVVLRRITDIIELTFKINPPVADVYKCNTFVNVTKAFICSIKSFLHSRDTIPPASL